MRDIKRIFLHCSFTKPRKGRPGSPLIGAKEIRKWHMEERRWSDIGYHYVVKRDGTIEMGRPVETQGAHAAGHNKDSIGICLVGGMDKATGKAVADYTEIQMESAAALVLGLEERYGAKTYGHNEVTKTKSCPNFDVPKFMSGMVDGLTPHEAMLAAA